MFGLGKNKISTESYKGVRDFYPEDQAVQNYIFGVMRNVVESFGYLEYGASILEPLELYKSKSSEEIVKEQIYNFTDRGGREVALRPEMTPTVARMVAARVQELPYPLRWYSIPNLFRYEKPQRGRLREHFQLNVDIFGAVGPFADAEVVSVAYRIMERFGAKPEDFKIKLSSRKLFDNIFQSIGIPDDKRQFVFRLLDRKDKMSDGDFNHALISLIGETSGKALLETLYYGEGLLSMQTGNEEAKYLNQVLDILRELGINNVVFDPTLARGFDYYTGVVFEVFDTNQENPRSLFGGGRYDNLTTLFVKESVPAFGFGMGDVTIKDFLTTHNLLPALSPTTELYICVAPETDLVAVYKVAHTLRESGVRVAVDISGKKLSDQLKTLEKRKIPYVLTIGPTELQNQTFVLRNTQTREEKSCSLEELIGFIRSNS